MIHFLFSLAVVFASETSQPKYDPALVSERRQEIIEDLKKDLSRVFNRHKSATRRGDSRPLQRTVKSLVQTANKRLKASRSPIQVHNLILNQAADINEVVPPEFQKLLGGLNPYQAELASEIFETQKISGKFVYFQAMQIDEMRSSPSEDENVSMVIDLEKPIEVSSKKLKKALSAVTKANGSAFYAFILPRVPLPDSTYQPSPRILAVDRGSAFEIYQERVRAKGDILGAQVFNYGPWRALIVKKTELSKLPEKPSFLMTEAWQ